MKGFFNKAWIVDLGRRETTEEKIPDRVYEKYLGGKGLATWLLLRHNPPGVDPLSKDNNLIFAVGPATDVKVHGSARYGVFTKSPLTGLYCESYSGMWVADRLSRAGIDALILKGAASSPVFLEVSDKGVVFHDATDLWANPEVDAYKAEDEIKTRVGVKDAATTVIGKAGENKVKFATINNNYWRCAGRTGAGAVMGVKNVKGIAFHGEAKREVADLELLKDHWKKMAEKSKTDAGVKSYKNYGTTAMVAVSNTFGVFPTRYWQSGTRQDWERISGETLKEKYNQRVNACPRCFMACGNISKVPDGKYEGITIEGPEFETIYAFGGLCLIKDLDEIIYLNDLCDRLGIDTITGGNLVGFAMHATELGKVEEGISYGDTQGAAKLLEQIAAREGLGAVLAEGIVSAAKKLGIPEDAIHVKGLEPSGYDPRVLKGMGLAYAVSDRGACHLRCTFYKPELSGMSDPDEIEGKAEMFVDFEDRATLFDTLIMCRFFRDLLPWEDIGTIIRGTTGMDLDKEGLEEIARNVTDLARSFNLREGMTRDADVLPVRFHTEKLPPKNKVITVDELTRLINDYYELRGWDVDGVPPMYKDRPWNE